MTKEDESGGAKLVEEAAGVAASFVRTLGLTDIVFGSFVLYWVRVSLRGTDWPAVLPGTGYLWVDVVLLAAAAALVGKVLSLVVSVEAAVLDWALTLLSGLRARGRSVRARSAIPQAFARRSMSIEGSRGGR